MYIPLPCISYSMWKICSSQSGREGRKESYIRFYKAPWILWWFSCSVIFSSSFFIVPLFCGCISMTLIYIYLFIYLFIYGCTGSSLLHAGFLQLWQAGATLSCDGQALGHMGAAAVVHRLSCPMACVGSSLTRGGTHVPCTGRCILSHWTTREAVS